MAEQQLTEPLVVLDRDAEVPSVPPAEPPRSRRNVIAAGLAGLAGLVLGSLGLPRPAEAAAGGSLVLGSTTNSAGTSDTSLTTDSSGTALLVTQTGAGAALRGSATAVNGIAGFFTSANGPGVSGVTANKDKYAVYGGNDATTTGAGAAVRAAGEQNHGLVATTASTSAIAVKATNSAVGQGAGQGPAVQGLASGGAAADIHPSGSYYRAAGEFSGPNGVIGAASTETTGGTGVVGIAGGSTGTGVLGYASSATGITTGVEGRADSSYGTGVYGYAPSTTGNTYGVVGEADCSSGTGVYGEATSATGGTYGVQGVASSPDGCGLYGVNNASSGYAHGALAQSTGASSIGRGLEADGPYIGVYGYASISSGTTYAVYGNAASSSGYALFGSGNGAVTGNFSKAGGSFKIDHPLDPANKFLYHSFVESPDMKNVYDGVVTLDAAGEATVSLPDWFGALNRDFRYQLTAIGSFSPLYVKHELAENAFSIAGGASGQKVCWLLTGIRKDAWADAHRIPVEEDKPADERGLYLHPTENGQPAAKGIKVPVPAVAPKPTSAPAVVEPRQRQK
jgi:hypothetical protein